MEKKYEIRYDEDGRLVIDIDALGEYFGLETFDITLPNGQVVHPYAWKTEVMPELIKFLKENVPEDASCRIYGVGAPTPWVMTVIATTLWPRSVVAFMTRTASDLELRPLPMGEEERNMGFLTRREGDRIYIENYGPDGPEKDAHNYDTSLLSDGVIPEIPEGLDVFFTGWSFNAISACIAGAYGKISRSVFLKFQDKQEYVCAISNSEDILMGAAVPAAE